MNEAGGIEQVYVVPREALFDGAGWHGVRRGDPASYLERIERAGRYVARPAAESDPALKQIIPYLVLRDGDRVFLMRRTKAGGDARLHERYSIGVGGHLNPGDGGILGGLRREWREEIEADFEPPFEFIGLLNDDETDVGSVHFGVVYQAEAAGRTVGVREIEKLSGSFEAVDRLRAVYEHMETWSQLVFDAIADTLAVPTAQLPDTISDP